MNFGLFLGCNMPAIRPDVERAIRTTMPRLGVDLVDLEGYVCCPAFGTFPSMDEDAQLAINAWNLSIGEANGVDLLVECGSCYSSLMTGRNMLIEHEEKLQRANELLKEAGKHYTGQARTRHITDVLYNDVGLEKISASVRQSLKGTKAVVQYPCHTLFPHDIVGFEVSSAQPHILAELVEALGAEVQHFSREYQCCGGAGGFHGSSHKEASEYIRKKFVAIQNETEADFIVVSCITCLMHLDNIQKSISTDDQKFNIPVFDYNQLLALCMGLPPGEVASIASTPRDRFIERLRSSEDQATKPTNGD